MSERIRRPQNAAEWQQLNAELATEKEEVLAAARESKTAYDGIAPELREVLKLLKAERQTQGLSLAEIELRSGVAQSKLSHLENDPEPNPTLSTLRRYATALGKKLSVRLTDQVATV
jgi:hypothetical protein